MLESLPGKQSESKNSAQFHQPGKFKTSSVKTSFNTVQTSGASCVACIANQQLFQCSVFQRMPQSEREAVLRNHSLCRNCFKSGHHAKDCQSKFSCRYCKKRHHSLVCFRPDKDNSSKSVVAPKPTRSNSSREEQDSTETATPGPSTTGNSTSQVSNMAATDAVVAHGSAQYSKVLLATAIVIVEDNSGHRYPARTLLNSGSESNFVTERLSQRLRLTRGKVVRIHGIG